MFISASSLVPVQFQGLAVAVLYGAISVSITLFNKAVLSVYNFNNSNTLTLGQMILALVTMLIMRRYQYISFPSPNRKTSVVMFPLALWFCAMVVTGLAALKYVNVPIYNTLRRLTTFIVMGGEFLLLGKVSPATEIFGVFGMVGGAFVAGWGDLTFNFLGYALTLLNCVCTAGYLVWIKRTKTATQADEFEMMFYNNMLSIPLLVVLVALFEIKSVLTYPQLASPGFLFCFFMSAVQAFFLNYFIFLCSTMNSPLTTSVTGQMKAIVATIIGMFIFGDVIITTVLVIGLTISSLGSIYYAYIKYVQSSKPKTISLQDLPQPKDGTDASDVEKGNTFNA